MTTLKSYPAYKDSGITWLDGVPAHWTFKRLRGCLEDSVAGVWGEEPTFENEDDHIWCIRVADFDMRHLRVSQRKKTIRAVPYSARAPRQLRHGDLLLEKSGGGDNQPVGRAVMFDWVEEAVTSNFVTRLRPDSSTIEPRFLLLVMETMQASRVTQLSIKQTTGIQNLEERHYLSNTIPLPPLEEQRAIADFLDGMDARITRFIAARRKMIALLEEQKQAVINRAVTRGLDPDVPMKDSGVDWLGKIPAHWEVRRLGHLIELLTGFPFKSEGFSPDPTDMRLLRGINVSPGALRWDTVVYWPSDDIESYSAFALCRGDIVMGMDRPVISNGVRIAIVDEDDLPALLLQRVARIRANQHVEGRFLYQLFAGRGFSSYLEPIFTGISVPHISPEQIRNFQIPFPPLSEQHSIVEHIDGETSRIDTLISHNKREIDLMQEYRTRLISDVVTGKLDVRGVELPPVDAIIGEEAEAAMEERVIEMEESLS